MSDLRFYKPKHFKVQEVVDPQTYSVWGDNSLQFMDTKLLISIDNLWEYFNKLKPGTKVIINNWLWGGQFSFRGFRPMSYLPSQTPLSQHRHGRAVDLDVIGYTAEQVRQIIIKNYKDPAFQYITTLETKVTWVHLDVRNVDTSKGLYLVNP